MPFNNTNLCYMASIWGLATNVALNVAEVLQKRALRNVYVLPEQMNRVQIMLKIICPFELVIWLESQLTCSMSLRIKWSQTSPFRLLSCRLTVKTFETTTCNLLRKLLGHGFIINYKSTSKTRIINTPLNGRQNASSRTKTASTLASNQTSFSSAVVPACIATSFELRHDFALWLRRRCDRDNVFHTEV